MLTRKSIDTVLLSVGAEKLSQREWDWMKMLKPMDPPPAMVAASRGAGDAGVVVTYHDGITLWRGLVLKAGGKYWHVYNSGVLQADAHGGYRVLYESGRITETACMAQPGEKSTMCSKSANRHHHGSPAAYR